MANRGYVHLTPAMKQAIANHYLRDSSITLEDTAKAFKVSASTVWKCKNEYSIAQTVKVSPPKLEGIVIPEPKHRWVIKIFSLTIVITIN